MFVQMGCLHLCAFSECVCMSVCMRMSVSVSVCLGRQYPREKQQWSKPERLLTKPGGFEKVCEKKAKFVLTSNRMKGYARCALLSMFSFSPFQSKL